MFVDFIENKIKKSITNDDCLKERVEIANHDMYAYPNRKYYYNIDVNNLTRDFYGVRREHSPL